MAEIPKRFFTQSDRIKQYLITYPDSTYSEAAEHFRIHYNILLRRAIFYKIRSQRNLNQLDHKSKIDCYRDLVDFLHEYGECTNDLLELLENYTNKTLIEQIKIIQANIKPLIESKS